MGSDQFPVALSPGIDLQRVIVDFQWQVYDPERKLPLDPNFWALSLAGEAGEVADWHKKHWRDRAEGRGTQHSPTLSELRSELGDVMICLALLAEAHGIDLTKATLDKLREIHRRIAQGRQGVASRKKGSKSGGRR